MRCTITLIICTFIILMAGTNLFAEIIHVPGDFETIQAAISDEDTEDGDTVLVSPGTYVENINLEGKAITVASLILTNGDEAYIDSTIIDGNENGTVVSFVNEEGRESVLDGFIVTGGNGTQLERYDNRFTGGGVLIDGSSPIIRNCIVTENITRGERQSKGGGIGCWFGASPLIERTIISHNIAGDGGGISCINECEIILDNVQIISNETSDGDNSDGGGIVMSGEDCRLEITKSLIKANRAVWALVVVFGVEPVFSQIVKFRDI